MLWRRFAIAASMALAVTPAMTTPAQAGFWGNLKQSFGTAVDNAERDGAKAAKAVGEAAGDAADAVVDSAESAAEFVTGDRESGNPQTVENTDEPTAEEPEQLTEQPN